MARHRHFDRSSSRILPRMASIGHIAVGMAAGKLHGGRALRAQALFAALSMLPDVDVIGFKLGVRYADPWGHRGASHSLFAAALVALACAALARLVRAPPARVAAFAFVTVASHGLLDALTNGGLGVALLWPFDLTRYFAPWRPIPVAPIGARFFSS